MISAGFLGIDSRGLSSMKKTIFGLYFILAILLSSCSTNASAEIPTATVIPTTPPTATVNPTATLIPCPTSQSTKIGEIDVFFHGDVSDPDCEMVLSYVKLGIEWFEGNGYEVGPAEIHYAQTTSEIVEIELGLTDEESREVATEAWNSGRSGYAMPGYAFFAAEAWTSVDLYGERVKTVLHELAHLEQSSLYDGEAYLVAPRLWVEGQAEYYGRFLTTEFGLQPASTRENLVKCTSTFEEAHNLESDPFGCLFMQGEQIFVLLNQISGENKSMDVWKVMKNGVSFEDTFQQVYGISYADFGKQYDEFRLNGY